MILEIQTYLDPATVRNHQEGEELILMKTTKDHEISSVKWKMIIQMMI